MRKSKVAIFGLVTAIIMLVMVFMPLSKVYASPDDDNNNADNTVYENNTVDNTVNNVVDNPISDNVVENNDNNDNTDNDGDNNTTAILRGPANNTRNASKSPVTLEFFDGMSIEEDIDLSAREYACLDLLEEKGLLVSAFSEDYYMQEVYGKNHKLLFYVSEFGFVYFGDDVSSADNFEYTLTDEDREFDDDLADVSKIIISFSDERQENTYECKITEGMLIDAEPLITSDDLEITFLIESLIERGILYTEENGEDDDSEVSIYSAQGKLLFTVTPADDDKMEVHLAGDVSYLDNIIIELTPYERSVFEFIGYIKDKECNYTKAILSFGDAPELTFIDGENQTYVIGSGETITLKASGDLQKFTGVKVNDELIGEDCYEAIAGSTIITFKNEYLDTLEEGTYKITLVYDYGEISTNLTVEDPNGVKAGDIGIALWATLIVASIGLIVKIKNKK